MDNFRSRSVARNGRVASLYVRSTFGWEKEKSANQCIRGSSRKSGGKTQINLEIKPAGTTWDNYDRRSDDFTGYCNYHIDIL